MAPPKLDCCSVTLLFDKFYTWLTKADRTNNRDAHLDHTFVVGQHKWELQITAFSSREDDGPGNHIGCYFYLNKPLFQSAPTSVKMRCSIEIFDSAGTVVRRWWCLEGFQASQDCDDEGEFDLTKTWNSFESILQINLNDLETLKKHLSPIFSNLQENLQMLLRLQ